MKKQLGTCFAAAVLLAAALNGAPARAAEESLANALMLMPSEKTAFDTRFQDFLNRNGARFTESFPPSAFIGHVPEALDAELEKRYGVRVYRDKVDDMAEFFKCGATAVLAGNAWNKRYQEDPPQAPTVISQKVNQAGEVKLILRWNEIMKAVAYRLQISRHRTFDSIALETVLAGNSFDLYTPFWVDGVYYWRVAGLLALNNGLMRENAFSEPFSFSFSRPASRAGTAAPALPASARFKRPAISWPRHPAFKYYRLQLSAERSFGAPLVDVFTATETFKVAGLPLERETTYFMRLMGADKAGAGAWSGISEFLIESPPSTLRLLKKPRRKARQIN